MTSLVVDALVVMAAASAPVAIERLRGLSHVSSDLGGMFIPHYAWWWSAPRWLGGWNPWIFGGFPSNADPLVGHVHPLGVLWAAFPPLTAAALEGALAPALTGLGMLLYLRRIGCGRAGSVVGALAFACGGYVHAHGVHPEKLRSVLAIPWALLAIEALEGRRLLAGLAAAVAVVVAGGHPQTIAFALALIAAYGAVFGAGRRGWVAAALVVGIAIPAVTWMPALELIGRSSHARTIIAGVDHFGAACAHTLVVPFGCGGGQGPIYGRSMERFPGCGVVDCTGYPGMLPWLLLLVGVPALWSTARGRFWLVVAVLGLVLSTELTERVLRIPGVRAPSRALLWWSIGTAAAAALAFRAAVPRMWHERRWWIATAVLVAVVAWASTRGPVARRASVASLGVLGATVAATWSAGPVPMIAVLVGDLLLFGSELHAGADPTNLDAVRSELRRIGRALHDDGTEHGRALAVPIFFDAMWAQVERVPLLQGWNVLVPEAFSRLLSGEASRVTGYEFGLVRDPGLLGPDSHVLDLLRASVVVVDRGGRRSWTLEAPRWRARAGSERWSYWVNDRARPVGWLVHRVRTLPDDEAVRVVRGESGPFDPSVEALASDPIAVDPSGTGGVVRVVEYGDDAIRLHATAPAAALLVTSELAYPGWRVDVDGTAARLHTVNAGFRAVAVSAGEHEVVFRYRPTTGRVGVLLGALGLAIVAGCALPRRGASA